MRTKIQVIGTIRDWLRQHRFAGVVILVAALRLLAVPVPAHAVEVGNGLAMTGDTISLVSPVAKVNGGFGADVSTGLTANHVAAVTGGAIVVRALADADVPDNITATSYCALAGGSACTMTGQIITDNLGVEFEESDTNPTCSSGNFNIFADASENKLKKCENGVATDLDTTGAGSVVSVQGFSTTTSIDLDSGGTATVYVSPFSGTWFTDESKAKVPYDSGTIGDFRCRASGTTGVNVTAEIVAGACDSSITTDCTTGDACATITGATATSPDADTEAVSDGNCVVVEITTAGNPASVTYSCSWTFTR